MSPIDTDCFCFTFSVQGPRAAHSPQSHSKRMGVIIFSIYPALDVTQTRWSGEGKNPVSWTR